MDEEASTSLVARRTPRPTGLRSIEEQRKKEEEKREQKTWRQLQEQERRPEPQELQEQHQQGGQEPTEPLDPPHPELEAPQEPRNQEEGLPAFGPPTPAWLRPGAPAAIPAESGRADGVVALACMMCTPTDPDSEIRRTIYGMDGIAPDSSGSVGRGRTVFPPRRTRLGRRAEVEAAKRAPGRRWMTMGGSPPSSTCSWAMGGLDTVEELIRGVKARADQEMENWCPDRIRIRASTDPSKPNIFLDDRKEAEKWEHVEELHLSMKHTVGLLSDVVNNGLGPAYFVSLLVF